LKATIMERKEIVISRQWLGKHTHGAMNTHATLEELLDTVFSTWSMPRICNEDQTEIIWLCNRTHMKF
jgi:hypothetical protein